ncbi:purine-binding chemotaxis protein CheW [Scytonema hofmannii FACHB-248]|uniref:Purine-binding chemotaxis protein CheW n=1 Tax=Scytonema hofmannii FACHB-248 TaxID=1842502 RepID=A0ABR8GLX5_9CYAN|nr:MULTISPECIES: chemotaxis protein CheW [Nostocales]MBD2604150.1 purine-binding chemotaxis protein CheW [Scytonema hofmannii FACHB-248]
MQKFLSFNLGTRDIAVISLQEITEVVQVPLTEICCVPQMPSCVLGIYNWRGEMLWLVNLEEMLGYKTLLQQRNLLSKMMTIVLENKGKYLGLLVRQLMDIEWLDTQQMKPPFAELFSPEISPLLQGYFIDNSEKMMLNLDAPAIIDSPMWKIHN